MFAVPEEYYLGKTDVKIKHRGSEKTRETIGVLMSLGYVKESEQNGPDTCLACLTRSDFAMLLPRFQCKITLGGVHMQGRVLISEDRIPIFQFGSDDFVAEPNHLAAVPIREYVTHLGWTQEQYKKTFKGLNGAQRLPFDRTEIQSMYSTNPYCRQVILTYLKRWFSSSSDLDDRDWVYLGAKMKTSLNEYGLMKHLIFILVEYLVKYFPKEKELFVLLTKKPGLKAVDIHFIYQIIRELAVQDTLSEELGTMLQSKTNVGYEQLKMVNVQKHVARTVKRVKTE